MKGLLIKDIRMTLQNKRLLAVILLLAAMLTLSKGEDRASFVISFVTAICGTLVLNTISVDEFDKSIAFLMTMPIDKRLYVVEKYVFALGSSLVGWIGSFIFCMIFTKFSIDVVFYQALLILALLSFFQMIILPIHLKFGGEVGRIVLLGMVVFFVLLAAIVREIEGNIAEPIKESFYQAVEWLLSCDRGILVLIGSVVWIGCFLLSVTISKNIMKKKEY